jgi:hypothetical protein
MLTELPPAIHSERPVRIIYLKCFITLNNTLQGPELDGKIILKCILFWVYWCELDQSGSGWGLEMKCVKIMMILWDRLKGEEFDNR